MLRDDEGHDEPRRRSESSGAERTARRTATARVALIVLALSGAFSITVELVSSDWAAFRLSDDLGSSAGFAGLAYVAFTLGMTVGRLGGDTVMLRLGSDRLLRLALAVSAVGLTVASFSSNRWLVLVAYAVTGLGGSTFFPKLYDDAAKFKGRRGAGLTWLRTGSSLTALVVPTLVGVLASTRLTVGAAVAIVTLPCVFGLFVLSARSSR